MADFNKCNDCNEKFWIFVDEEEFKFCPVCNSANIKIIKDEEK